MQSCIQENNKYAVSEDGARSIVFCSHFTHRYSMTGANEFIGARLVLWDGGCVWTPGECLCHRHLCLRSQTGGPVFACIDRTRFVDLHQTSVNVDGLVSFNIQEFSQAPLPLTSFHDKSLFVKASCHQYLQNFHGMCAKAQLSYGAISPPPSPIIGGRLQK